MKIKIVEKSYSDVMALPQPKHKKPIIMGHFWRVLIKLLSHTNLAKYKIKYTEYGMEKLSKKEPCLVLMNHSGFIDMQIAADYLYPRPFSTVSTTDGYVGLATLMHLIGCIPTQKFVTDISLIRDISYALKELKTTVLMYPEACYSFDGTANALPESLGRLIKMLKVPVVTLITHGAFHREPLYNMLRHRNVKLSADVTYLISPEDTEKLTTDEINLKINEQFSFDSFKWQQENGIEITEDFRTDGLERVLYKCPHCMCEDSAEGKGVNWTCKKCGAVYELTETGYLRAVDGNTAFDHIPSWYDWERSEVSKEINDGKYLTDTDVDIYMLVDYKALYKVGDGHLIHNSDGFILTGCNGELKYEQSALSSYTVNSDYYWYEIGDMISIGNKRHLFYLFPNDKKINVAKVKLAAEELYKLKRAESRK